MPKKLCLYLLFRYSRYLVLRGLIALKLLMHKITFWIELEWTRLCKFEASKMPIHVLSVHIARILFKRTATFLGMVYLTIKTSYFLRVGLRSGLPLPKLPANLSFYDSSVQPVAGYLRLDYIPACYLFSMRVDFFHSFINNNLSYES
jgi:hypothetical protein